MGLLVICKKIIIWYSIIFVAVSNIIVLSSLDFRSSDSSEFAEQSDLTKGRAGNPFLGLLLGVM